MNEIDAEELYHLLEQIYQAFEDFAEAIRPFVEVALDAIRDIHEALTRKFFAWRLCVLGLPEYLARQVAYACPRAWLPVTWAWEPITGPPG